MRAFRLVAEWASRALPAPGRQNREEQVLDSRLRLRKLLIRVGGQRGSGAGNALLPAPGNAAIGGADDVDSSTSAITRAAPGPPRSPTHF